MTQSEANFNLQPVQIPPGYINELIGVVFLGVFHLE